MSDTLTEDDKEVGILLADWLILAVKRVGAVKAAVMLRVMMNELLELALE